MQTVRPHIVILLADDLGWADAGFHGSEIRTPSLDRLASQSLQLERFYSCPVCSPTRSALMTGRYPMRFGIQYTVVRPWSNYGVPLDERLMPQSFQAAGYETAMAGKWHLGHGRREFFPSAHGFDHSYGHFNGAIDYYSHVRDGGLDWHRNGKPLREAGYSTELLGAEAVRRIKDRSKDKPLFLYVPFNAPHSPLQAPKELIESYGHIQDRTRRTFAAMVTGLDTQVGKILDALEQEKIAENTLVFFFSDNGGPTNLGARNTPLRGAKASTWEGGIRVPALMRWPSRLKPGKSQQVMAAMDLFSTLASLSGVKPGGKLPLDGRNLWNELSTGKTTQREDLFSAVESGGKLRYAVFHGPWKLVREVGVADGQAENFLFRIAEDPTESKDLASANPEMVADLVARIEKWRAIHPPGGLRHTDSAPADWKAPRAYSEAAAR